MSEREKPNFIRIHVKDPEPTEATVTMSEDATPDAKYVHWYLVTGVEI